VFSGNGFFYSADPVFSAIAHKQGFDGKPSVVSPAEMDRLIAEGRPPMFRAASEGLDENDQPIPAAGIQEQLRTGPARFGTGSYGSGYYFSNTEEDAVTSYGDGTPGSVAKAVLKPDARRISADELQVQLDEYRRSLGPDDLSTLGADLGRFGAAQGYDVIDIPGENPGEGFFLVLNRTALIVENPSKSDDKVTAARQRQAQIDEARKAADLIAEFEERRNNGEPPEVTERALRALARRIGMDEAVAEDALQNPDDFAAIFGLERTSGPAGSVEPYDPKKHKALGKVRPGQMVTVVRPSYAARIVGGRVGDPEGRGPEGLSIDPATRDARIENRVRTAWNDSQHAPGGWVGLSQLRNSESLRDLPREDVDAALKRLARQPGVRLAPNENTKSVDREDRQAALRLGDSDRNMIAFERPVGGYRPADPDKTALRPLDGETVVLDKAVVEEADDIPRAKVDDDQLHHYWTRGEGLAKWRTHPHPWTALRNHLRKHVPLASANRMASQWFKEVFGYWPGSRKGTNPVGPG
jgi:hypothetical protein